MPGVNARSSLPGRLRLQVLELAPTPPAGVGALTAFGMELTGPHPRRSAPAAWGAATSDGRSKAGVPFGGCRDGETARPQRYQ